MKTIASLCLLVFLSLAALPLAAQASWPAVSAGASLIPYLRLPMLMDASSGGIDPPLPQAAFRAEWDSSLTIWERVSFAAIMGAEYALPSLVSSYGTGIRGYIAGIAGGRVDVSLGEFPGGPILGMGAAYHLGTWTNAPMAFQAVEAEIRFRLGFDLPSSFRLELQAPLAFLIRTDCLIPSIGLGISLTRQGWAEDW